MRTWVKLYTKVNHDPEIGSLTWAQRGIWSALLALAGEIDDRDGDDRITGRLDTLENTAWRIRCDSAELQTSVDAFVERGWAELREGVLYLTRYRELQERAPSASREAVAGRVKQCRAKAKRERNDVTPEAQRCVTPPESDSDSDTESESGANAPGAAAPTQPPDPGTFQGWRDLLQAERHNRPAVLMRMFRALYPDHDPPEFSYLGRVARQLGAARLAQLLWEQSPRPPVDDVLAYCLAVAKGGNGSRASPRPSPPRGGPPGSDDEIMPSGLTRRQERLNRNAMAGMGVEVPDG